MKILVIGCKGMLGQDLMEELTKKEITSIGMDISEIDITKPEEMDKITKVMPDILINCAAYTNVDLAEKEKEKCFAINVTGINNLVINCKQNGITLVNISTDYVFDGNKTGYDEEDSYNPINYYGKTKSEGEEIIKKSLIQYYIIRTSWLFGRKGKNFVSTIIKIAKEKKEIKVVNDQTGRPTYTRDLCIGIIDLLIHKKQYGTYHITNSGSCTWYQFALEILRQTAIICNIEPCTTQEFPRDAKRPKYSILDNNKTENLRNWKDALKAYLEE